MSVGRNVRRGSFSDRCCNKPRRLGNKRAAGHIRQPLGEQAARAAFGHRNRRAVFRQHASNDFFKRFAASGIEILVRAPVTCDRRFRPACFCALPASSDQTLRMELDTRSGMREWLCPYRDTARTEERRAVSTSDSGKPVMRRSRVKRRCLPATRARRGFTCALEKTLQLRGHPREENHDMCHCASSQSPGAVPLGLGRTVAPSGTRAWRALISGITRPGRNR